MRAGFAVAAGTLVAPARRPRAIGAPPVRLHGHSRAALTLDTGTVIAPDSRPRAIDAPPPKCKAAA